MHLHEIYEFETAQRLTRKAHPAPRRRTDRQLQNRRELIDLGWTYGLGASLVSVILAVGALA